MNVKVSVSSIASELNAEIAGLSAKLSGFIKKIEARLKEWEKSGDADGFVAELAAVISDANSLSQLLESFSDGTEESVEILELKNRFGLLQVKAASLMSRWQSLHSKGMER